MYFSIPDKQKHALFALFLSVLTLGSLSGCGGHVYHRVEPGETLYSIGWIYGYDYRQIAKWNDIPSPYVLSPGQSLRVVPPSGYAAAPLQEYRADVREHSDENLTASRNPNKAPAPVVESASSTAKVVDKSTDTRGTTSAAPGNDGQDVIAAAKTAVNKLFNRTEPRSSQRLVWHWPVKQRRLLRTFSAKDPSRQGLDFAGEKGQPVFAAASGRVVYAGSGLVRHGRLIIIKHNEKFLSAYAHNQKLHVKEGESVKAGQRIANMGRTGNLGKQMGSGNRAKLHFEIRRNGEPVNPSRYLPK